MAVGLFVAALVFILALFPRLNSADDLLSDLHPAFTEQRVEGARAGVTIVSQITDLADPIATDSGTAAAEVPMLVDYVSQQSGLPPAAVLSALQTNFPQTTNLLLSLPLSDVTAELPKLIAFLSTTLKLPPDQVTAAIQQNFPGIAQVITALPMVTDGWDKVPGTEKLTSFDGAKVTDVPSVRDYFANDVVGGVLEGEQVKFQSIDGLPGGPKFIPPLLILLGIVVAIFGFVMSRRDPETRGAPGPWAVVTTVGIVVMVLVVGVLQLFSRLDNGQKVLDASAPAFTKDRVEGSRAGINMVSSIVDLGDPIATEKGTAAKEVPELVAFVSEKSGLPPAAVLSALSTNFPKTTHLLQSLPLSSVNTELPKLVEFLATTLKITPQETVVRVVNNFPGLAQVIVSLPPVVTGWDKVPGTENFTRFDGGQVTDVPDVRDYFSKDAIPVLETQRENFADTNDPSPSLTVFAPLLLGVGLLVTLFGGLMFFQARKRH